MAHFMTYLLIFITHLCIDKTNGQKVDVIKVTVYYDAYGQSSSDFITQQLYPSYKTIGKRIILDLVPYGSADGPKVFIDRSSSCAKGPYRCYANIVHACAVSQTNNQADQLAFVNCLFKTADTVADENIEKCAIEFSLSSKTIKDCASGSEGITLLKNNGFQTKTVYPPIYRFPVIAVNDFPRIQRRITTHFLTVICSCLNNPPPDCTTAN